MPLIEEVGNVLDARPYHRARGWHSAGRLRLDPESVHSLATFVEMPMSGGRTLEVSNFKTPLGAFLISMRDVTERKQAERAYARRRRIGTHDRRGEPDDFHVSRVEDGRILYAPPASRDQFGDIRTTLGFFRDAADRERFLEALLPTGHLRDFPVEVRLVERLDHARAVDSF